MTNVLATLIVSNYLNVVVCTGIISTASVTNGSYRPYDMVEHNIEYAQRLNQLRLLGAALDITLDALEGLHERNKALTETVSNLTARVEALERRPHVEFGPPIQTPHWTPLPMPQYQWPTGFFFGVEMIVTNNCTMPSTQVTP